MDKVQWGIIGCGDVTEVKSGPALQLVEGSSLVAVMRRNGELAKDYAKRHGVPKWYDDAEALIEDPEVTAIYVATPPSSHKEYVMMAARALKPVYVEKPMALNLQEATEMNDYCKGLGVPLYVAYYRRALPRFLKVKDLIEEGYIGEVRYVITEQSTPLLPMENGEEQPWRVRPEVSGGGIFFDMASHTLDLLDYLLGPIEEVKGLAVNQAGAYRAEDAVSCSYTFASGVIGTGLWNFAAYREDDWNKIVGTKGEIVFSSFREKPVILYTKNGEEQFIVERPKHIQQPFIQKMVEALYGRGNCPSTGDTALRTNKIMEKILADYYK
ncbi:Gfo/Idh/MocA family protein [Pontibacillus salicampi]|uniref:Gfo/Idh/MocA family protein n=1 Tax=Pontibacillus salicampi TaxID=1449801 RepID=A0ABV6LQK6_9BACI